MAEQRTRHREEGGYANFTITLRPSSRARGFSARVRRSRAHEPANERANFILLPRRNVKHHCRHRTTAFMAIAAPHLSPRTPLLSPCPLTCPPTALSVLVTLITSRSIVRSRVPSLVTFNERDLQARPPARGFRKESYNPFLNELIKMVRGLSEEFLV